MDTARATRSDQRRAVDWETPARRSFVRAYCKNPQLMAFLVLLDDLTCEGWGAARIWCIVSCARLMKLLERSADTVARRVKQAEKEGVGAVISVRPSWPSSIERVVDRRECRAVAHAREKFQEFARFRYPAPRPSGRDLGQVLSGPGSLAPSL
jgi:hypothetical protein